MVMGIMREMGYETHSKLVGSGDHILQDYVFYPMKA